MFAKMNELKIPNNDDFFSCSTTKSHHEKISSVDQDLETEILNIQIEMLKGQFEVLKDELYSKQIFRRPKISQNQQDLLKQKIEHINKYLELKNMQLKEENLNQNKELEKMQKFYKQYNVHIDELSKHQTKKSFSFRNFINKKK